MPRINIEDELWHDARFKAFSRKVGSEVMAIGSLIVAWRAAQSYFKVNKIGIPVDQFKLLENWEMMLECRMAEDRGEFIYFNGSAKAFNWLLGKSDFGKLGGIESARVKRGFVEIIDKKVKQTQADSSRLQPSSSSSSSSSNSNTKKKTIVAFAPDFESLYQSYPLKKGKMRGLKQCGIQITTREDFDSLSKAILNYREDCRKNKTEPKYIKHFSTFLNEWRDWTDPDVGTVNLNGVIKQKRADIEQIDREMDAYKKENGIL